MKIKLSPLILIALTLVSCTAVSTQEMATLPSSALSPTSTATSIPQATATLTPESTTTATVEQLPDFMQDFINQGYSELQAEGSVFVVVDKNSIEYFTPPIDYKDWKIVSTFDVYYLKSNHQNPPEAENLQKGKVIFGLCRVGNTKSMLSSTVFGSKVNIDVCVTPVVLQGLESWIEIGPKVGKAGAYHVMKAFLIPLNANKEIIYEGLFPDSSIDSNGSLPTVVISGLDAPVFSIVGLWGELDFTPSNYP